MGEEVKVIGSGQSLFSFRVEWALKLKGVEYEYIKEDVRNKSPLLLHYNPVHKKVPVLVHRGKPLPESLVILEYIDDTWMNNHPLLPENPYERAMARFWAKYADEKCLIAVWQAYMADGEEKEKAMGPALESLAFLEKEIKGKKFFGGEKMGFLDLAVGWIPHWLNVLEEVGGMKLLDAEKFPSLHEWAENFIQIPLIKDCIPPRDDLVEYFHAALIYLRSLSASKP